jgi:hypothetical protein
VKVEVTVTSERLKNPPYQRDMEKYVTADVAVEGDARLIADTLRALADSIWMEPTR